jgi:hypothetical protein
MSFLDKLLLWLHIGFAIFAIGPVTATTMFTPRYIRARDVNVLRYLHRSTRIFGILTLGVFLAGLALGGSNLGKPYLSVSMTLFIVALVLLVAIDRDRCPRTVQRNHGRRRQGADRSHRHPVVDHGPDLAGDPGADDLVQPLIVVPGSPRTPAPSRVRESADRPGRWRTVTR